GGMTRMSGAVVKDMELHEPDEYTEFNAMNPGNSAPMVVWLASDQALHVTGQVFRAVGNTIAHYKPWALQPLMENKTKAGEPAKWEPEAIGDMVNGDIFGTRATGLRMGR
ncbi:MAG TPA: hypothetical protein VNY84_07400, partial [Acidimicrobiales bacterium]|nr:hypothetical protein [Acidimicrobiales bacterium]